MHILLRVKFGQHINQRLCVHLTLAKKDIRNYKMGQVLFILAEYVSKMDQDDIVFIQITDEVPQIS